MGASKNKIKRPLNKTLTKSRTNHKSNSKGKSKKRWTSINKTASKPREIKQQKNNCNLANGYQFYCDNRELCYNKFKIKHGDSVNIGECRCRRFDSSNIEKSNIQFKNPFVKVNETNEIKL